jgi:hypothetical protein
MAGDGSSEDFPGGSCKHIYDRWSKRDSGTYWLSAFGNMKPERVLCDQVTSGGGWMLVWQFCYGWKGFGDSDVLTGKYSFWDTSSDDRYEGPQPRQECSALVLKHDEANGWCNIPEKRGDDNYFRASQQATSAYMEGALQYWYQGNFRDDFGIGWMGAAIPNGEKVVDKCTTSDGIPPEPMEPPPPWGDYNPGENNCGLGFDKANHGNYRGNCDTITNGYANCKWQNCHPSGATTGSSGGQFGSEQTQALWIK